MPSLPVLKTGAVMQYPVAATIEFQNQVLRYVGGSEQRYRGSASGLRRWVIRLDLLDERELDALENFFVANRGRFESFSFTDPADNVTYPNCSLEDDIWEMELEAELRGRTRLTVRQNRN